MSLAYLTPPCIPFVHSGSIHISVYTFKNWFVNDNRSLFLVSLDAKKQNEAKLVPFSGCGRRIRTLTN